MSEKKKLVGIGYNAKGDVIAVCKIKYLFPNEIISLVNEQVLHEEEIKKEKLELISRVSTLENLVKELEHEIKILKGEE